MLGLFWLTMCKIGPINFALCSKGPKKGTQNDVILQTPATLGPKPDQLRNYEIKSNLTILGPKKNFTQSICCWSYTASVFRVDHLQQDAFGADVMRLWVSSVDYTGDVTIGPKVLRQMSDVYRKLRGTLRFLLGNLHDWKVRIHLDSH